jgi:hypothetical protein
VPRGRSRIRRYAGSLALGAFGVGVGSEIRLVISSAICRPIPPQFSSNQLVRLNAERLEIYTVHTSVSYGLYGMNQTWMVCYFTRNLRVVVKTYFLCPQYIHPSPLRSVSPRAARPWLIYTGRTRHMKMLDLQHVYKS